MLLKLKQANVNSENTDWYRRSHAIKNLPTTIFNQSTLGVPMKNMTKAVVTSLVMLSVLVGCQSLNSQPTSQPDITGTDVI